jgi:hypothetical protein
MTIETFVFRLFPRIRPCSDSVVFHSVNQRSIHLCLSCVHLWRLLNLGFYR